MVVFIYAIVVLISTIVVLPPTYLYCTISGQPNFSVFPDQVMADVRIYLLIRQQLGFIMELSHTLGEL